MKIISLVGARPQYIKEAMLGREVRARNAWEHILVNSGQHYDFELSDIFFRQLDIPKPAYNLNVGSGTHAQITSSVMLGMESLLMHEKPDALIVYGDTDTTLGGALAASKLNVPVVHVEAGIRSLPKTAPEEINRLVTDHLSRILCTCSPLGMDNLKAEGFHDGLHMCGDIMYDVFCHFKPQIDSSEIREKLNLRKNNYIVATIHRNYNTDNPENLRQILAGLVKLQAVSGDEVVMPMHPRTRKCIDEYKLEHLANKLRILEPLGYIELLSLVGESSFVVTDSGGLQKEAYYQKKRCLVIMPATGWRELTDFGWNILADSDVDSIMESYEKISQPVGIIQNCYGNGSSAKKIIESVKTGMNNIIQ